MGKSGTSDGCRYRTIATSSRHSFPASSTAQSVNIMIHYQLSTFNRSVPTIRHHHINHQNKEILFEMPSELGIQHVLNFQKLYLGHEAGHKLPRICRTPHWRAETHIACRRPFLYFEQQLFSAHFSGRWGLNRVVKFTC